MDQQKILLLLSFDFKSFLRAQVIQAATKLFEPLLANHSQPDVQLRKDNANLQIETDVDDLILDGVAV